MKVTTLGEAMRSFGANPLNAQLEAYLEEFEEQEKGELVRPAPATSPAPGIRPSAGSAAAAAAAASGVLCGGLTACCRRISRTS